MVGRVVERGCHHLGGEGAQGGDHGTEEDDRGPEREGVGTLILPPLTCFSGLWGVSAVETRAGLGWVKSDLNERTYIHGRNCLRCLMTDLYLLYGRRMIVYDRWHAVLNICP